MRLGCSFNGFEVMSFFCFFLKKINVLKGSQLAAAANGLADAAASVPGGSRGREASLGEKNDGEVGLQAGSSWIAEQAWLSMLSQRGLCNCLRRLQQLARTCEGGWPTRSVHLMGQVRVSSSRRSSGDSRPRRGSEPRSSVHKR